MNTKNLKQEQGNSSGQMKRLYVYADFEVQRICLSGVGGIACVGRKKQASM